MRLTQLAHAAVRRVAKPGDTLVDATVGNGHDTLFLAKCVGPAGRVYGFDVQEQAIDATRARLLEAGIDERMMHLIHGGHEHMKEAVRGPVTAAMFNLGYLPGGDHGLTTGVQSTLSGLAQALELLRPGGVITIVCYRGHPGGAEEAAAVCGWARSLENAGVIIEGQDQSEDGPFLVLATKS